MVCLHLIMFSLFIIISWARLADDIAFSSVNGNCVKEHCFHQPESACPSPESKCRCRQLPHCKRAAVCCNVNKFQLTEGFACANISTLNGYIEALHIRNASLDILNVSQPVWRRLRYMTITNGRVNRVVGEFAKHSIVSCLNLSSNGIVHFDNRSLVNLFNLSFLDLARNELSDVPRLKKESNVTLDISKNKPLYCQNLFDALKRTELSFSNSNDTFCLASGIYHWFNSTENVPLIEVISVHELQRDCLINCTCEILGLAVVRNKTIYRIGVTCTGLTSLPTPLPPNTFALNVSNNFISSLELINTDPSYESLGQLYADNNKINSILPLEGSKFMSHFTVLSLRHNKITSLPTYVFSNSFDRNSNDRTLNLGQNFLQCDCNTAKVLKVWLLTKQKNIPDYYEIYCDDSAHSKVLTLNPSNYCQTQQDWTDYIYYIITAEVLMLIGLISKVCYDYWVFKTSGYLPWPASKMPKLPCDWLCE